MPASSRIGIVQVVLSHGFGLVVLPCTYIRILAEAADIAVAVTPRSWGYANALRATRPRNHALIPLSASSDYKRQSHTLGAGPSATEAEQRRANIDVTPPS